MFLPMKYTRPFFLSLFVFSFVSLSFAQHLKFSAAERTIIRLQDDRHGIDTIASYLDSKDEKAAWRAAVALANIHDTASRPALIRQFKKEKRQYVSDALAFALGALGPNTEVYRALSEKIHDKLTDQVAIALGRTVPKEMAKDLTIALGLANGAKLNTVSHSISYALTELGVRKIVTEDEFELINTLESSAYPETRWQAIYGLTRTEDSAMLSNHLDVIKLFLTDAGSQESRMFAATALGRVHNNEAGKILIEAARSETQWRVRVNIINAIGKLYRYSSAIHDVLKKAVTETTKENPVTEHVARAALDVLDGMIAAGKVSSPDSVTIRDWLADYQPSRDLHEEQSVRIRSQCMIPLARLWPDETTIKEICSYISFLDRTAEINTWKAVGLIRDTNALYRLLQQVFSSYPISVVYVLDGLHSNWELAKKDPSFMRELEITGYAMMYRHMLIRFPSLTDNPSIVATTLEQIKDPFIVKDSLRREAGEYLLQYLDKYAYPKYHDDLISIFSAIAWLKPKNDTFRTKLEAIIKKAAFEWGDQMIVDSAGAALSSLGIAHQAPAVTLVREPIDWKAIESLPDTLLILTQYGFMFLKLDTYNAPLTALNMYNLAKINFFANNYIHRVVPNFVIQSGDNTGTGDGGPGYAIRTEISPVRYDSAGAVGMASSGKDTEGSQWFITHCPTPHLNIRYTIWGEIVKGKENIDKYLLNDQIENIIPHK